MKSRQFPKKTGILLYAMVQYELPKGHMTMVDVRIVSGPDGSSTKYCSAMCYVLHNH